MAPSIWARVSPTPTDRNNFSEEAARRLIAGPNQYAADCPACRNCVWPSPSLTCALWLDYDWRSEVVVTSGATEGDRGLPDGAACRPGDEGGDDRALYDFAICRW